MTVQDDAAPNLAPTQYLARSPRLLPYLELLVPEMSGDEFNEIRPRTSGRCVQLFPCLQAIPHTPHSNNDINRPVRGRGEFIA